MSDIRIEIVRVGRPPDAADAPMPPIPPIPPLPPGAALGATSGFVGGSALALHLPAGRKGETRALGSREFDGVRADGSVTTYTIVAGEIGNERPILIESERWHAPELDLVVYTRHSDPRAGETVYRLTDLRRGEPAPELFRVPADYTRRSGTSSYTYRYEHRESPRR